MTRLGHVAFRFVTLVPVTVPGKGGRPRKWRSDADRVRAFRARQRGDAEPATFESALDDGDELARAIQRGRDLQADLVTAIEELGEVEAELQAERRRHAATRRALERAKASLDERWAAERQRAEELSAAHDELRRLANANTRLQAQLATATQPSQAAGPNRAARRQAAKRDRRER